VVFGGLSAASAFSILLILAGVALFLLVEAAPVLSADSSDISGGEGFLSYVAPLVFGTLLASIIAMVVATPVAVGIALFVSHYVPRRIGTSVGFVIDLLAAVPSVVFGMWGFQVLAPRLVPLYDWLEANVGFLPFFESASATGRTILTASLVLAVMILPIITAVSREVFLQTPRLHEEAALALGATKWEMIRTAVVPYGRSGVVAASMLGLGRALGETVAVMIILSQTNSGGINVSLFAGGETFASKIANNAAEFDSPAKTGAYIAAGLVLFVVTFAVNAIARLVADRRPRS